MRTAPWTGRFPRRGQKLAECRGMSGQWVSISFITSGRFVELDPLKQFAPVLRGNYPVQGRIAMGSPPPEERRYSLRIGLSIKPI